MKPLKYSSLLYIPPGEAQTRLCYVHVMYLLTAFGSYNKDWLFFFTSGSLQWKRVVLFLRYCMNLSFVQNLGKF
jgi:hypothetical protein